jgi:hypothetical protein
MARRGTFTGPAGVAFLVALLVVGTVSPAAAVTTATPAPSDRSAVGCFPADGTEFVVGTEGPQIRFVLHLSLLPAVVEGTPTNVSATNASLPGGTSTVLGAFGIEAVASTGTDEVVSLQSGVLFEGVENATAFLSDPFGPFALVFDYRLTIPAFEGTMADSDYRAGDVPVDGPVEEAACSR